MILGQKEYLDSLKDLKNQKNLKVLQTDKANKITIMDIALVDQKLPHAYCHLVLVKAKCRTTL